MEAVSVGEEEEEVVGVNLRTRGSKQRNNPVDALTAIGGDSGHFDSKVNSEKGELENEPVFEDIEAETEAKGVVEEEEKVDGEVVNEEESKETGSFDFAGNNQNGNGENRGTEATNGYTTMEHQIMLYSSQETNVSSCTTEEISVTKSTSIPTTEPASMDIFKGQSSTDFKILESVISYGEPRTATNDFSNSRTQHDDFSASKEGVDKEIEVYDVEKVLEKQETHDLFCPNCNSCITKRVILRRRKRKIQEISSSVEDVVSEPVKVTAPIAYDGERGIAEDFTRQEDISEREDREPIFYRCLSCFSIFIPSGRWAMNYRNKDSTIQDAPHVSSSETSTAVPTTVNEAVEPATSSEQDLGKDSIERPSPLKSVAESLPEPAVPTSPIPSSEKENHASIANETTVVPQPPLKSVAELPLLDLGKLPEPAVPTSPIPSSEKRNHAPIANEAMVVPQPPLLETMVLPADKPLSTGKVEDDKEVIVSDVKADSGPGGRKEKLQIPNIPSEGSVFPPSTLRPNQAVIRAGGMKAGKDVIISIPESSQIVASPETEPLLQDKTNATSTVAIATSKAATPSRSSGVDIIKSIVYGGLLESIASLSVVTSAAGADAATLNILALGLANVIGGLFVLVHNLRVLKHETSSDQYVEALGQPGHFTLHATIAVISYILLGLLPPVVYAFTFRQSDSRDYKIIAVAVSSLLCIILLSLGKAYVRSPPKGYMKTVTYYVGLGVLASGASYVAGDLMDLLLEKLGLFESSSSSLKASWVSY